MTGLRRSLFCAFPGTTTHNFIIEDVGPICKSFLTNFSQSFCHFRFSAQERNFSIRFFLRLPPHRRDGPDAGEARRRTRDGEDVPSLSVRVPFAQVAQPLLTDERFVQLHRSYVVNLAAVSQLAAGEFWMQSGARVPVPRGREPAARTALKDYLEKQFR